jgi:predicted NUDIX family NTP pyrophosphohydrolase
MAKRKGQKRSAGLLMYRWVKDDGDEKYELEVFIVHPGGPFWVNKDHGAWTLPKGEYGDDEEPLAAAQREFHEETGFVAAAPFIELGAIRQKSGKIVTAWAFEGDCDPALLVSNTCKVEWPPKSGKRVEVPEVDRGRWFRIKKAHRRIREEQAPLLDALRDHFGKTRNSDE